MFGYLKINITIIDNSYYPTYATFCFVDSNDKEIIVVEKLDILTSIEKLPIPTTGFFLKCRILEDRENVVLIDISEPFGVFSINNECIFSVNKKMISEKHFDE